MSSGFKKEGPRYAFFFSLKRIPSRFPNRAPMETAAYLQGLFLIYFKFLTKSSVNKEIFPFSQRIQERSVPPCSPNAGSLWKQTPISSPLLSISFGVSSKGVLSPDSPPPWKGNAPSLELSFIYLPKFPVYEPPSRRFSSGAPKDRDVRLCNASWYNTCSTKYEKITVQSIKRRSIKHNNKGKLERTQLEDVCTRTSSWYNNPLLLLVKKHQKNSRYSFVKVFPGQQKQNPTLCSHLSLKKYFKIP